MYNDKTTLRDLSIFAADGSKDVFSLLDVTVTQVGRDTLRKHIQEPPASYEALKAMQDVIGFFVQQPDSFTEAISNGTIVMLEKFFEANDATGLPPTGIALMMGSFFQKMLNKNQYFFTQFSLSHLSDFLRGCKQLTAVLKQQDVPALLKKELSEMDKELQHRLTDEIVSVTKDTPYKDLTRLSYRARREMKNMAYRLIDNYARIDAWYAMAKATAANNWVLPKLLPALPITFSGRGVYHPLLQQPVAYDIDFSEQRNFLLLTGANMSGKTTFMRALGVSALLAHLGMGVPAKALSISFLQGVITNMQVEDNIMKGESYFFAEVQRMKHTAQKLLQSEPHLVLMDELFKGTNVHDAYECTRAVVEGLLHHPNHMMVLSTHLYEVAQHYKNQPEILFAYFVTQMQENGSYHFTYELKRGISDDRIGYRILQKEGVIDLLRNKPRAN